MTFFLPSLLSLCSKRHRVDDDDDDDDDDDEGKRCWLQITMEGWMDEETAAASPRLTLLCCFFSKITRF